MDLAQSYIHMNSLFTDPPPNATITSQGWLLQIISGAAWMTTPYAGMSMQYLIFAVFSVGLGFSSPEDWPDTFGTWKHAYTVRNFWGFVITLCHLDTPLLTIVLSFRKFWHQMIRRVGACLTTFFDKH